jgi:hypothetical protein
MKSGVSFFAVGHATSLFLAISFILCVVFDLLFPDYAMYQSWQALVPGFVWLSWKSFFIGLIQAWAYGWYFALIWVPIYNFVALKGEKRPKRADSAWGS